VKRCCAIFVTFYCTAASAHIGAVVSLARFTDPPPLLTAPDGGVTSDAIPIADGSFDVEWNDGDMDPTGRYFFYYLDHQPPTGASTGDVVKLATPIPEGSAGIWTACDCIDGNGVFCPDAGVRDCRDDFVWDTHALAPGSYWIIAVDNDPPYYLYSVAESPLRVAHAGATPPPAALFITPNGIGSADANYKLSWVAAGDGPLQFDLAWGQDVEPQLGDPPTSIGANLTATDEGKGAWSYLWDTSALPSGDVFVQLTVRDASARTAVTDSLNLKIFHPSQVDAAVAPRHDLSMAATPPGGSCEVSSDAPAGSALFVGAIMALLLGLVARRSTR
jgi:hypothetical protein